MLDEFNDLPKMIAGMLQSKEKVIHTILEDIETSNKIYNGLKKCSNSVIDNPSEENLRKMVNTTMKCATTQAEIITKLCIIALLYCGGANYDSDAVTVLNKLGHGKEALRQMFKNKMEGYN